MEEIWKPVIGFEKFYEVSNTGKVKSLRSGKLRKLIPNSRNGYLYVVLCGIDFKNTFTVHRLVAMAFCEKPNGCDFINHKDEDKHNNNAENLEWVTKYYNNTYNGKTQRCCKAIEQLAEDGTVIKRWSSAREAYKALGIEYKNISTVCRGLRPRAGGYRWRFAS
jgi:hypothetical protein